MVGDTHGDETTEVTEAPKDGTQQEMFPLENSCPMRLLPFAYAVLPIRRIACPISVVT